jgi:putative tricarboxylic transport membrane protein
MIKDKISFISSIVFFILSGLVYLDATTLSDFAAVFPLAIGTILVFLSILLLVRSFKLEIKIHNDSVLKLKVIVFFGWIYFLERSGFIITSLIAFNLLVLINCENKTTIKQKIFFMTAGTIFVLLLYFGFKNLLQVPLPEGLWFGH